jgi:hypothetical protein
LTTVWTARIVQAHIPTITITKGLKFRKFDLHVHTPASASDFNGKAEPGDVVQAALAKGLAGIAITDHQTASWVDRVKEAAGKNLVVFPGVELLVQGGEAGVHILLLFDVDRTSKDVKQFLDRVGAHEKDGKPTVASPMTVAQVADELAKYDPSAIIILAHCHSSKGVTGRSMYPLMTLNIDVLVPMPSPSVMTATKTKPGERRSDRTAKRRSFMALSSAPQ